MDDSGQDRKKSGMSSWQLKSKGSGTKDTEKPTKSPGRETFIEQAKQFLEKDEVRNASTDKKIAFLESKGLRSEEIQDLLRMTPNPEASAPAASQVSISSLPPIPA